MIESDDPMVAFRVAVAQVRDLGREFERGAKELLSYPADTLLKRGIMKKKIGTSDGIILVINPPDTDYSGFLDPYQIIPGGIAIECQQSLEEKFKIFKRTKGLAFYPTVELTKEKIVFAIPGDAQGQANYPEYLEVSYRHNVFCCIIKKDGWNRPDPASFEGQPSLENVAEVTNIIKEITGRARSFFSM